MIGSGPSNTNLNNSNDDANANSSSKVDIGHQVVPSTAASTDSVFEADQPKNAQVENSATGSQDGDSQPTENANQDQEQTDIGQGEVQQHEIMEQQQKLGDEVAEQTNGGEIDGGNSQQQQEGEGGVGEETGSTNEGDVARPQSSASRNTLDEYNSLTKLPEVIVRKSITAAVNRLSLNKDSDDDMETSSEGLGGEKETSKEGQDNQASEQQEGEGKDEKEDESHSQQEPVQQELDAGQLSNSALQTEGGEAMAEMTKATDEAKPNAGEQEQVKDEVSIPDIQLHDLSGDEAGEDGSKEDNNSGGSDGMTHEHSGDGQTENTEGEPNLSEILESQ